jgi:hypothetical protein
MIMTSSRLPVLLGCAVFLGTAMATAAPTSSSSMLEQRVRVLQDKEEIRQILIRYGEYLDARDYAGYASLFASNGISQSGFGVAVGPAAIQAILEKNLGKPEPGFINKSNFHLMTTEVVDVQGDKATARSRYLFLTATPENKPAVALAGRYVDEFVRENGVWKLYRRTSHGVIPWRDGNARTPPAPPAAVKDLRQ